MRQVALPGGGHTSCLGFGCAGLKVSEGVEAGVGLLAAGFDAGVSYVDVARSYGYGTAESVVGRFLVGRRDDVTVVTKAGIAPPAGSAVRLVAGVARQVVARSPRLHRALRRGADARVRAGDFTPAAVVASVTTSLRELGTDHVDLLLLHEVAPDDVTDELLTAVAGLVDTGAVRGLGTATGAQAAGRIAAAHPLLADAAQVPDDGAGDPWTELGGVSRLAVTHSVLREPLRLLGRAIADDPDRGTAWAGQVGADLADRSQLVSLLLARALADNPSGVVLFSSTSQAHVRHAAHADGAHPPEQVARFRAVLAEVRAGAQQP